MSILYIVNDNEQAKRPKREVNSSQVTFPTHTHMIIYFIFIYFTFVKRTNITEHIRPCDSV